MDVDAAAVELYGLAPEQFTAARNAAAKAAKDGGDVRAGEAIKTLRKPTLAAWPANQLVRADPDGVNDLTELGEQLRQGTRVRRRRTAAPADPTTSQPGSAGRPDRPRPGPGARPPCE